jgi:hypothetical protein
VPAHIQYFSQGSMRRLADALGVKLVAWSDRHDAGEAFEAWLAPSDLAQPARDASRLRRLTMRVAAAMRARFARTA